MRANAHLRLIVSEPAGPTLEDGDSERTSIVQPVSGLRLQVLWLRQNPRTVAWWLLAALLVSLAAGVLGGRA